MNKISYDDISKLIKAYYLSREAKEVEVKCGRESHVAHSCWDNEPYTAYCVRATVKYNLDLNFYGIDTTIEKEEQLDSKAIQKIIGEGLKENGLELIYISAEKRYAELEYNEIKNAIDKKVKVKK